jgi:uncharacterized protein (DUF927 family)
MNKPLDPKDVGADLARLKDAIHAPMEPPLNECPHRGGRLVMSDQSRDQPAGVYFIGKDKEGNDKAPLWICAPLRILAKTRGTQSGAWGRLLEWRDAANVAHRWAMPLEMLAGDGLDVLRELLQGGLAVGTSRMARELLNDYLQVWPVAAMARCVDRLGWLGGVYVLPNEAIGAKEERVVFQSTQAIEPTLSSLGTLEGWRDQVAGLAQGNSRMVFAIACAFAPSLADIAGEDSGGFHLRGLSSLGKSAALALAASVWGSPKDYPRLWRTTTNGLEGLATLHNDGLLILDELSQVDPKDAGEATYMLANGQGKTRATKSGSARTAARWQLMFLSAGEESLSALMLRTGKKANAGQEVRLADITVDAGAGMGAFETLHSQPSPAALVLALKDAATKHHGAVGVAWLHKVVGDRPELAALITKGVKDFVAKHAPAGASGQVVRVARRFGLVAVAGELATAYGFTGWPETEASNAVGRCFSSWLEGFGGDGNREDRALLSHVRAFFESHGSSRFENTEQPDQRVANRAGFYRTGSDGVRQFFVLAEVFSREICNGLDRGAAVKVLVDAGMLEPGRDGKASQTVRISGAGVPRVYCFTAKVFGGES